jgi:hypothetical protein
VASGTAKVHQAPLGKEDDGMAVGKGKAVDLRERNKGKERRETKNKEKTNVIMGPPALENSRTQSCSVFHLKFVL